MSNVILTRPMPEMPTDKPKRWTSRDNQVGVIEDLVILQGLWLYRNLSFDPGSGNVLDGTVNLKNMVGLRSAWNTEGSRYYRSLWISGCSRTRL